MLAAFTLSIRFPHVGRGGAISEHIEFFAAPDDVTAAAVRTTGPAPYFTTVSGAFFEADEAVVAWENLLSGRADNNMATSEAPRIVASWVNDGSAVLALSDHLVACLIRTEPSRFPEIAQAWSADV